MSIADIVEPDAEEYEESEESRDIKAQEVTGEYIEPENGQDPEAAR